MQSIPLPKIQRITYGGDPKNDFSYHVGQTLRVPDMTLTISSIIMDETRYHLFGDTRYVIYAKNGKEEKPWKVIENMPVTLTFDFNSEQTV